MRIRELYEMAWDRTLRIPGLKGGMHDLDVHRNPSRAEFSKLLNTSRSKVLRGSILRNGDLLVWDAWYAFHGDVDHHPEYLDHGNLNAYLYFRPNQPVMMNDIQYHREDDGEYGPLLQSKVDAVRANPSLIRIYGKNFPIIGVDNDTDEEIAL
jgi:hypothetical protein